MTEQEISWEEYLLAAKDDFIETFIGSPGTQKRKEMTVTWLVSFLLGGLMNCPFSLMTVGINTLPQLIEAIENCINLFQ